MPPLRATHIGGELEIGQRIDTDSGDTKPTGPAYDVQQDSTAPPGTVGSYAVH